MHAPGELVGGRYRVTDRPLGAAVAAVLGDEQVRLVEITLPEVLDQEDWDRPQPWEALAVRVAGELAGVPAGPRLLRGFEAFVEGRRLWVAEEAPAGSALTELTERPWEPYRVAELAADLARALAGLHAAGVVHGNVAPESVLVGEDGAAMLGGLLPGAVQEAYCRELGGVLERRVYEARAVLLGVRAERWAPYGGAAGDGWALGVLMHRLLTGRAPYPERDLGELLAAVRDGRHESLEGCGPLREVVAGLLAGRLTVGQLRPRLAAFLAGAPEPFGPGRAAGLSAGLPVERAAGPVVTRPRGPVERRPKGAVEVRRSRVPAKLLGPLLVGALLALMVAAVAAVVALGG
ncbi:hypothetical protein ACIRBX_30105 [Kitasatospora sp. NPDC096147]|uniref:protein kinase domain-containing protein n=1 Tax=Kitasatospora sp. NPDC096147 TaxID=3364093 RepID=UPI00380F8873